MKATAIIDPDVKFPEIEVELVGRDGNAFAILGVVKKAMVRAGVQQTDVDAYVADATGGDYDHLLAVTAATVNVR